MTVAFVVLARDVGEHAHLFRRQHAVGHGDAQHGRLALNVEAVLQTQRTKFVFRQLAREETARLVAILRDPFVDNGLIVFIVLIHSLCGYQTNFPPMMNNIAARAERSTRSGT